MSFIAKLFCCCKRRDDIPQSVSPTVIQPSSTSINSQNIDHLPSIVNAKRTFNPSLTYEVRSKIPIEAIQFKETLPELAERKNYRYSCPLCFRYFNHMLQCFKCKNYACRFCADDIGNRCLEVLAVAHCPFCDASPFIVIDVDKNEPIKKYTDTPYSSCLSGFRFSGRAFHQARDFGVNQKATENNNIEAVRPLGTAFNFSNRPLMVQEFDKKANKRTNSVGDVKEINDLNIGISTGDKENVLEVRGNIGWENSIEYNVIRQDNSN